RSALLILADKSAATGRCSLVAAYRNFFVHENVEVCPAGILRDGILQHRRDGLRALCGAGVAAADELGVGGEEGSKRLKVPIVQCAPVIDEERANLLACAQLCELRLDTLEGSKTTSEFR